MAAEVHAAIDEGRPVIVEAGTGTGKTLAYLIPALLSRRKTIVSTGTKTLQDQILEHDIPLLSTHLGQSFRVVCMKGRTNYLCFHRLQRALMQPELVPDQHEGSLRQLADWAQRSARGDRAEIDWLSDDFLGWNHVSARGDQCLGQRCAYFDQCFLTRLREEAAAADLVVVNHHLFFADLALRSDGYGQVIPRYEAAVFDEAHLLEETANQYFSIQVSSHQLHELLRDVRGELAAAGCRNRALMRILESLGSATNRFFAALPPSERRNRFAPQLTGKRFGDCWRQLNQGLEQLGGELQRHREASEGLSSCHRRTVAVEQALEMIVTQRDPDYVYWYETRGKATFLWASPVQVAPILQGLLFERLRPYIFTSATLAVRNQLAFFTSRIGLPPETRGLVLDTPFSYREQALIYLPTHLPLPDSPDFTRAAAAEIAAILEQTLGRAFILFTSYRNLREVHAQLGQLSGFTFLVQGEQPKAILLRRFSEDTASVLLGTASFWQGVDVPGEALSCVVIDKLPFAAPSDPLVAARLEIIAAKGGNPFQEFQIPQAVLTLRQGLGRLIRRATDRGVLAILDGRLYKRSYGRIFLESLPQSRITHRREDIGQFLAQGDGGSR
jgi:ATP-dependent DNA helicase DinG